ncbi:MAG: sugar ABC transporter ATP-binding protein [Spirochaetota bacterium]|nr:MAG: sugar ABC transporter ATP-binding protein [Spirochaetota bacterium]
MQDATNQSKTGKQNAPLSLLQMEGISKSFGGVRALSEARLEVEPSEIHTVFGENGAGKTTLVKIIAGVYQHESGRILWNGEEIRSLDLREAYRMGIRIIYQRLNTIPHLSVQENLVLGREPTRFGIIRRRSERRYADDALERVGIKIDLDRQAGTLPVAERQIIEIARALYGDVRLLVMDEPTASLGEREVERLFGVMRNLREEGVAIIFISHKLSEVMEISDRVTVLRDGHTIGTVEADKMTSDHLVEMMVGRELRFEVQRSEPTEEVLLEAVDLWTATGLRGVSLTLRKGEVLGVYGLMGSGRTELARALFGADKLVRGHIRLEGQQFTPRSPYDGKHLGIGFVPEDRLQAIFYNISVRENISSASGELITRHGIIQQAKDRELSMQIVKKLGVITPSIEMPVHSLSGGNQQKVILGKWLIRGSRVLILDDPTSGVDVGTKSEIYQLISDMTRGGTSVIMSSSELPELLAISNRILVLHRGQVAGVVEGENMTQRNVLNLAVRGVTPAKNNGENRTKNFVSPP